MLSVYGSYLPGADDPEFDDQATIHLLNRNVDHEMGGPELAYGLMMMSSAPIIGSYKDCREWHDVRTEVLRLALPASCMSRIWWKIEWKNEAVGQDFKRWQLMAGAFNETFGFAILIAPHWDTAGGLWFSDDCDGMESNYNLFRY